MTIGRHGEVFKNTQNIYGSIRLINDISSMRVRGLVIIRRNARLARIIRATVPRIRRPLQSCAGGSPGHGVDRGLVAPHVQVRVRSRLQRLPRVALGWRDLGPVFPARPVECLGCVEEPGPRTRDDQVDQVTAHIGRIVPDLCPDHVRC